MPLRFALLPLCALLFLLTHCQNAPIPSDNPALTATIDTLLPAEAAPPLTAPLDDLPEITTAPPDTFSRAKILARLQDKIDRQEPLVVHIFIPLCDNIHQGIVPTSASLGDGMSTRTNLYWATSTGTKKFFQRHVEWTQIYGQKDAAPDVLERVVFERDYDHTKVYLVADAYRGDRMSTTLNDFLAALSANKAEMLSIDTNRRIPISSNADLLIFNGHNGLMDAPVLETWTNTSSKSLDAVIHACVSYDYFEYELKEARAYPLLRTTSLLHPGAYVLTQVIDDWVNLTPPRKMGANAGRAYCKVHDCGRGSKIYKTGWQVE